MKRIAFSIILCIFLIFIGAYWTGVRHGAGAEEEDGVYRVDISVLTMGWAYPGEDVILQAITFLDRSKPSPPGEPPQPFSPEDWIFLGNISLSFEMRDEAGAPVEVDMPRNLQTGPDGHLEKVFKAPDREGNYTVTVYARMEGKECTDSEGLVVSSEERVMPKHTPLPTPILGARSYMVTVITLIAGICISIAILLIEPLS